MLALTFMAAIDQKTISNAVAGGALGFGAIGLIAPKVLVGTFGLPDTGPFRFLSRLWGTRTAVLGFLALTLPESERKQVYAAAAAMNAVDAAVAVAAGPDLSGRTKVMAALTSGTFAVASAAVALELLP